MSPKEILRTLKLLLFSEGAAAVLTILGFALLDIACRWLAS